MPLSPFQIVADISDTETQDREEGGGEREGEEKGRFKLEFCVSTSVRGWFVRAIKSINGFACLPTFSSR